MNEDLYNNCGLYSQQSEKFYRLAYNYVRSKEDAMDVSRALSTLDHYEAIRNV